jgi:hypothetical protein
MKRISSWHRALEEQLRQGQTREFAWGSFDCALFACDCVWAQTGEDPAVDFRGKYSAQDSAEAFGSISAIAEKIAAQFGLPEIAPGHAGRGDVVLIDNRTAQGALAVIDFTGSYAVCPGSQGLIRVRRHRWLRAWRI